MTLDSRTFADRLADELKANVFNRSRHSMLAQSRDFRVQAGVMLAL